MINRILAIVVLLFLIFLNTDYAKAGDSELLTINRFLLTVNNDYCLQNHEELLDYLETASSSTPYIDKIELRTDTEELRIAKQKYALRFFAKGWGETKYNNKLKNLIMKSHNVEHKVYYSKALEKRYNLISEYCETVQHLKLLKELNDVYEDRISILKTQAGTLTFDVSDYILAENRYTELQLDIVKLENRLTGIIHKIYLTADSDKEISFDENQLIGVEEIVRIVNALVKDSKMDNIYLKDRKNKVEKAKLKYNIEKAQERDYLSYVGLEYDYDNSEKPNKAYSLNLSIKLPFINSDREDINRRKVNYIEEKLNYEDEKRDIAEKIESTLRGLNRYIDQYRILKNRKENGDARNPLETYMKMEGINPLNLLEIRENIINNDLQQSKIYFSVLNHYIDLMDLLGKLSEKPSKNYISRGIGLIIEQ